MIELHNVEELDDGRYLNPNRVHTDRLRVEGGWLYRTYGTVFAHTCFVPDFVAVDTNAGS